MKERSALEILQSGNSLGFLSGALKRHITLQQLRVGRIRSPAFVELSALNHPLTKTLQIKQTEQQEQRQPWNKLIHLVSYNKSPYYCAPHSTGFSFDQVPHSRHLQPLPHCFSRYLLELSDWGFNWLLRGWKSPILSLTHDWSDQRLPRKVVSVCWSPSLRCVKLPAMAGCRETRVRGCKAQHSYWLSLSAEGSPWAQELLQWKSTGCSRLLPHFDDAITSAAGRECVLREGGSYRWYHNHKAVLIHLCASLGILSSGSCWGFTESYRASNILSHIEPVLAFVKCIYPDNMAFLLGMPCEHAARPHLFWVTSRSLLITDDYKWWFDGNNLW